MNQQGGIVWSAHRLCNLDLKALRPGTCIHLKSLPVNVFLTDREVYISRSVNSAEDQQKTAWHILNLSDLKEQDIPQNLKESNQYPQKLAVSDQQLFIPESSQLIQHKNLFMPDNSPKILEMQGPRSIQQFRPFNADLSKMAVGSTSLAVSGIQEELRSYDITSGKHLGTLVLPEQTSAFASTADQQQLSVASDFLQPMLRFYAMPDFKLQSERSGLTWPLEKMLATDRFLIGFDGKALKLWDLEKHLLLDTLAAPACEFADLQAEATQLIYSCDREFEQSKLNNPVVVKRRLLLIKLANQKFQTVYDLKVEEKEYWSSVKWQDRRLWVGTQTYELLNKATARAVPGQASASSIEYLAATWPYIILDEKEPEKFISRILPSLEKDVKPWLLTSNFLTDAAPDFGIKFREGLLSWYPSAQQSAIGVDLKTGQRRILSDDMSDFEIGRDQQTRRKVGNWTLILKDHALIAENRSLEIRHNFHYPGSLADKNDAYPVVWVAGPDSVLIHWRNKNLLERCNFTQGYCSQPQYLPADLRKPEKVGNRLFGYVVKEGISAANPPPKPEVPCALWMWDTETLDAIGYYPLHACSRLSQLSPPGTVTLRNEYVKPDMLNHHQILSLTDGSQLASFYSITSAHGLLLVTEEGYYAGYGDYLDLAYLMDGEKVLSLKDFPAFHRPDLVWKVLQGQKLQDVPRLPGLKWEPE